MKVITEKYNDVSNRKFGSLEIYAEQYLDGRSLFRGAGIEGDIDAAQKTADNVARAFGRLLDVLYRNEIVTEEQVGEVFEDESLRIVEDDE